VNYDYLKESPMKKMKPPKLPEKHPVWITEKELQNILANEESLLLRDIYQLLFFTGLRVNELLSVKWDNININEDTYILRIQMNLRQRLERKE
jgi:integrase